MVRWSTRPSERKDSIRMSWSGPSFNIWKENKRCAHKFNQTEPDDLWGERFNAEVKQTSSTWMKALGPDARARGTSMPCSYKREEKWHTEIRRPHTLINRWFQYWVFSRVAPSYQTHLQTSRTSSIKQEEITPARASFCWLSLHLGTSF